MPTIEQLGHRLSSLHEMQSVVRTMKVLSAASIRQYEQAALALADYYRTVKFGLHVVLRDRVPPPQVCRRDESPLVAIVFGSDHGLCGRFNEDLVAHVTEHLGTTISAQRERMVLAVGARIAVRLEQAGQAAAATVLAPCSVARITASIQQVLLKLDEWRAEKNVGDVHVFYNQHIASAHYRPTAVTLLPVNFHHFQQHEEVSWPSRVLPTYTLDRERLFSTLLQQYFFVTLFRACAETQASEHGSRLAAMRVAEKNLQERVDDLETEFRQIRQGLITGELLDVVAGFEALTGKNVTVDRRSKLDS